MSEQLLVTFNAGSSTVKIGLFAVEDGGLTRIGKGMIDFRKAPLRFELSEGPDRFDVELEAKAEEELDEVLREAFDRLSWHYDLSGIVAIGHRAVSYTHLRAHQTSLQLVCRLLLEKKNGHPKMVWDVEERRGTPW